MTVLPAPLGASSNSHNPDIPTSDVKIIYIHSGYYQNCKQRMNKASIVKFLGGTVSCIHGYFLSCETLLLLTLSKGFLC